MPSRPSIPSHPSHPSMRSSAGVHIRDHNSDPAEVKETMTVTVVEWRAIPNRTGQGNEEGDEDDRYGQRPWEEEERGRG